LSFDFYPAGQLTMELKEGRNLINADKMGRQDPYCMFTLAGEVFTDVSLYCNKLLLLHSNQILKFIHVSHLRFVKVK
jgi:hypothetical protein